MSDHLLTPRPKRPLRRSLESNVSKFFSLTRSDTHLAAQVQPLRDESTADYAIRMAALSQKSVAPFSTEEFLKFTEASAPFSLDDLDPGTR